MKTSENPVIVEQLFKVTQSEIWEAITSLPKMKQWYFNNIPDFKPVIGFKTEFMVSSGERNFLHQWEITEVIANKKISYTWTFEGYQGKGLVHFELFSAKNGTLLKLTNEVLKDFSDEIPEFKRESCLGGWNYFIKEQLKNYLEKE